MDSHRLARRSVLVLAVSGVLDLVTRPAFAARPLIKVYRDPGCGCCSGWARHLIDAGYPVRLEDTADLTSVRTSLGVPQELAACHTAEVDGYVVEGHVPVRALDRLLFSRPVATGLAVPGMPPGSPGMENDDPQPYTVVLFGSAGRSPFMRFKGKEILG